MKRIEGGAALSIVARGKYWGGLLRDNGAGGDTGIGELTPCCHMGVRTWRVLWSALEQSSSAGYVKLI